MGPADEEAQVLKKIAELNLGQSTSAFSKFGCKNAGFVEAMVLRGTSLHRGGFELTEVGWVGGGGEKREKGESGSFLKSLVPFVVGAGEGGGQSPCCLVPGR